MLLGFGKSTEKLIKQLMNLINLSLHSLGFHDTELFAVLTLKHTIPYICVFLK